MALREQLKKLPHMQRALLEHGPGSRLLQWPAIEYPSGEGRSGDAVFLGRVPPEFAVRIFFSVVAITGLRYRVCPSAVGRFVVPIHVDPLDAEVIAVPVRESPVAEDGERLPFSADRNTAAAVILVTGGFWISASVSHRIPYPVYAGFCFAVLLWTLHTLQPVAAAGYRFSFPKISPKSGRRGPAVAPA